MEITFEENYKVLDLKLKVQYSFLAQLQLIIGDCPQSMHQIATCQIIRYFLISYKIN